MTAFALKNRPTNFVKDSPIDIAAGIILLSAAAFFSISLLVRALDFGTYSNAHNTAFFSFGSVLYDSYGFSSPLIPVFLLAAGILCFSPRWSKKRGIYLAGSIIPFFTTVAAEKICRKFFQTDTGTLLGIKIAITLFICALIISIEYLVVGIASEVRVKKAPQTTRARRRSYQAREAIVLPETEEETQEEETTIEEETIIEKSEPSEPIDFSIVLPPLNGESDESSADTEPQTPTPESSGMEFFDAGEEGFLRDPFAEETRGDTAASPAAQGSLLETTETILKEEGFVADTQKEELAVKRFVEAVLGDDAKFEEQPEAEDGRTDDDAPPVLECETVEFTAESAESAESAEPYEDDFLEQFIEPPIDRPKSAEEKQDEAPGEIPQTPPAAELLPVAGESAGESVFPTLEHFVYGENDLPTDSRVNSEARQTEEKKTVKPLKEKAYSVPVEGLLSVYPDGKYWVIDVETDRAATLLQETLNEFSIQADVTGIKKGPVITMFEILPAPGVKLSRIVSLQDNIALRLAASSVRIVAPIPGKHAVGIEVPNKKRAIVSFREIIETGDAQFKKMTIPAVLGKDITGEAQIIDLAKTPHMLIAGATGSGKSVCVNSLILSILYTRAPAEVKMILIDPKIVELKLYNDIPHLLTPVITEPKRAFQALQYCLCEMERRYALLDGMGVRDIVSYNQRIVERRIAAEKLPSIVIIIDEFADLMATTGKELESTVARLAAMSRAVGIHLVLATQRPSIDVITGLIKANIPTRVAFMVASKTDSRIIIDQAGAEKLLGKGDMLYSSAADPFPMRIQGTFVSDSEVENVADYVKHLGEPEYIDDEIFVDDEEDDVDPDLFGDGPDPLYDKALEIVVQAGKASASYVQRRLKIGYNRAARLIEEMEHRGIVGPANGSKPRDIVHLP